MKKLLTAAFGLLSVLMLQAQYRADNVLYKTVFPQDLCRELAKQQGYLLLDVRSAGEFSDTSASASLNIGHFTNAVNIDIRQIDKRLNEIATYKDRPVFVYCSHSQRSRRVSKMLADSGFTNISNINGGMTAIHMLSPKEKECLMALVSTGNSYAIISPQELCNKLSAEAPSVYVLDVRPDSSWNHVASNPKFNAYGYIKGSQHIALDDLGSRLPDLPKDKEIIVTDITGTDAAKAARMLKENGFDKVAVLLEGLDRWLFSDKSGWACAADLYVPAVSYSILSSPEYGKFQSVAKNHMVLDVRTADEFTNKHRDGFRNIGHLRNAINIPSADLPARIGEIEKYKTSPVVVYAFSGSPEAYSAANTLTKNGFLDVKVLAGGLFNIRWTGSNIEGMSYLHNLVEAVPEENK